MKSRAQLVQMGLHDGVCTHVTRGFANARGNCLDGLLVTVAATRSECFGAEVQRRKGQGGNAYACVHLLSCFSAADVNVADVRIPSSTTFDSSRKMGPHQQVLHHSLFQQRPDQASRHQQDIPNAHSRIEEKFGQYYRKANNTRLENLLPFPETFSRKHSLKDKPLPATRSPLSQRGISIRAEIRIWNYRWSLTRDQSGRKSCVSMGFSSEFWRSGG